MREQFVRSLHEILYKYKEIQGFEYLNRPIPSNFKCGIYFFFDELLTIPNDQFKITYIGITKNNKNNRLEKHQINGPSSFRDHVGEAIKNRFGGNSSPEYINKYIHHLPYLFVSINDIDDLKLIEKRSIELISNYNKDFKIHIPNENWLGYHHKNSIIPQAHIWNIQHAGNYDENLNYLEALDKLKTYSIEMINK